MSGLELILVTLGASSAILGFGWLLFSMIWQRWKLEYKGHNIEVRNRMFSEEIVLDGEVVEGTWFDGNRLTYAVHKLALPDGEELLIDIRTDQSGVMPCCLVVSDGMLVYDSNPTRAGLLKTTMQLASQAPAAPAPEIAPRLAAARVLLDELSASRDERVTGAVKELRVALDGAFASLKAAQASAQAHTLLGGTSEDVAALLEAREASIRELLTITRELHIATTRHTPDEPDKLRQVQDVLQQVAAESEVDLLARARRAAAAQREPGGG